MSTASATMRKENMVSLDVIRKGLKKARVAVQKQPA